AVTPQGAMPCDVTVADETITGVHAQGEGGPAGSVVEGRGKILVPGGVDPHVHFENPSWDTATAHDFAEGTEAAALGGTTTIIDFAFQEPGESPLAALERRRTVAEPKVYIDYSQHATVTDATPESIASLPEVFAAGYPTVKVFMAYGV